MTVGAVLHSLAAFDVGDGVLHAGRLEDARFEEDGEGLLRGAFDDQGEDGVGGIGIAVLFAGGEAQGPLLLDEGEDIGVVELVRGARDFVVVIGEAARMS